MKRIVALLLTALMVFAFMACDTPENPDASQQPGNVEDPGTTDIGVESAVELLTKVWDSYAEEDKFPAAGGDFNEENMNMEGPGKYGVEDTEGLDATLGLPASSAALIDDAASLLHMMNANTFTGGAFHVTDAANVSTVADSIKANLADRQWLCGSPEILVVFTIGDYVVSAFGHTDIINTFKTRVVETFESAELVIEETFA
ncbi:MAG: bacteriocin transport accessory protein [Clostridia bacterium]|nr:bacteriocin transport accessory protein [Clostridia bacterium]